MYIKRITIQGFKTYKNTTIINNISPHHNVLVGSNGSGKSNFFAAIRFVLSDDFDRLTREERIGLIHQGSGSVMSAYVEIVFDNSSGRIHISSNTQLSKESQDDVVIRRTIGLKKDEYSINGKSKTKQEVKGLLETAGFSTSNPYYIVPQGRIVALTNAKDHQRLELLKEVTGANTFEKKLKDSLQTMDETEVGRKRVANELKELASKLKDLEDEREELNKFQNLDRDRKCIEYTLYDRELNEVTNQIEKLESSYSYTVDSSAQYISELEKRETLVREIEVNLSNLDTALKLKETTDVLQLKSEKLEVARELADLNVKKADLESQLTYIEKSNTQNVRLLTLLASKIAEKKKTIDHLAPSYDERLTNETQLTNKISKLQQRQSYLITKRGRYAEFSDEEERNAWIQSEINTLREKYDDIVKDKTELETENEKFKGELHRIDEVLEDLHDSIEGPHITGELETLNKDIENLRDKYYAKIDQRKEYWREEQKYQTILTSLDSDIERAQRSVNESMDRNLANGLQAVKKISERLNLNGTSVFGTLGELIQYNEKYKTCVETIGGNSLFHVVVDNEDTASILMGELVKSRAGRVTFMPLNRLNNEYISYPPDEELSVPLMKKIHCDSDYINAVKQVFGKVIVVKDLTSGVRLAKQYKLTAITLDGDKADKKGVLTGGFNDKHKQTRLTSMKELKVKRKDYEVAQSKLAELADTLKKTDDETDQINGELKTKTLTKETMLIDIERYRSKSNKVKSQRYILEEKSKRLVIKIEKLNTTMLEVSQKITRLENDMNQTFKTELTDDETTELNQINNELPKLDSELNKVTASLSDIQVKIESIKSELQSKLEPQYSNLQKSVDFADDFEVNKLKQRLKRVELEISTISEREQRLDLQLHSILEEIDELKAEKVTNQKTLERANSQQRLLIKKLEDYQKTAETCMIKKTNFSSRRDVLQNKLRELGFLPEDSFTKYENATTEELVQKLNRVTRNLGKYRNVNKRAGESFNKFLNKKQELQEKAKELDQSRDSIVELIDTLKHQKVTAIEATFKKVAENFTEMFEKLVPRGTGKLIIRKKDMDNDSNMSDDESVDNIYEGVAIQVSFNSKEDEQLHVSQLSGGQKTVCAIALILAMQKVDPAPFYLFDEIDAALDKQYRTSVAATIKELSQNAQFICTTFRTDMLYVADTFYRVKFENKLSTIAEVDRENAIDFIRGGNDNLINDI
ncbi:related to Structural maintenance of chromosomes protein 3 [Saccharomycodes ludwigii]|uniref:Structural maintenance of chromosomes protein n=1 Tax=Saccharomycodes ludwigii TaxID=36035 RepID=A0A376B555_9ASCO|nr:related to Structural maintenance of chromosomes protein 3 [Saccharomycodes ludwigii]